MPHVDIVLACFVVLLQMLHCAATSAAENS
jgi:hypothetical protein